MSVLMKDQLWLFCCGTDYEREQESKRELLNTVLVNQKLELGVWCLVTVIRAVRLFCTATT